MVSSSTSRSSIRYLLFSMSKNAITLKICMEKRSQKSENCNLFIRFCFRHSSLDNRVVYIRFAMKPKKWIHLCCFFSYKYCHEVRWTGVEREKFKTFRIPEKFHTVHIWIYGEFSQQSLNATRVQYCTVVFSTDKKYGFIILISISNLFSSWSHQLSFIPTYILLCARPIFLTAEVGFMLPKSCLWMSIVLLLWAE